MFLIEKGRVRPVCRECRKVFVCSKRELHSMWNSGAVLCDGCTVRVVVATMRRMMMADPTVCSRPEELMAACGIRVWQFDRALSKLSRQYRAS